MSRLTATCWKSSTSTQLHGRGTNLGQKINVSIAMAHLRPNKARVGDVDGAILGCVCPLSLAAIKGRQVLGGHGGSCRFREAIQSWVTPACTTDHRFAQGNTGDISEAAVAECSRSLVTSG